MCIDAAKSYTAVFDTSEGEIQVALDTAKTPKTVNNFIVLSRYKYYDGTTIFRTDPSIDIIQGGGLTNTDDPGYTIEDEGSGYKYVEGDLAMARTMEPNSAGGQWFFVTGEKASLLDGQGTYVNFGKVTAGLDIVKGILALIADLGADGMTMVAVTHEMGFARSTADSVVFMDHGVVIESGPPEQVFTAAKTERLQRFLSQVL